MERTGSGQRPLGEGWFIVNAAEAAWVHAPGLGYACRFEGETPFPQLGVRLRVLEPGEPNCMYHRENVQEDFLVLRGECRLLVEGEERRLRAWDFFHCPPGTGHVFLGAGNGPCVLLMVGARGEGATVEYPVDRLATSEGAGVREATSDPRQAYASFDRPSPCPAPPFRQD